MQRYLKSEGNDRPRVFSVSTVAEFVEVATFLDERVIFRGQTTIEDWPLIPSVGRTDKRCHFSSSEEVILEEFRRESIPYLDLVPGNDWQLLAIAQHNRLPTRLLDWTRNPLAALWFAVKDPAIRDQPGVVWAFHFDDADAVYRSDGRGSPFSIDRTYVYFPEHVFPFIRAQAGVFTVQHRQGAGGAFPPLERIKDADLRLTKIEIPPGSFPTMCYQLFRVGVSPASLFPSLSGLVDRIRYDNMFRKDEIAEGSDAT